MDNYKIETRMAKEVEVYLQPVSKSATLVPLYDAESDILIIRNGVEAKKVFILNIDNTVTIDVRDDGLALSIDIPVPRARWKVSEPLHYAEAPSSSADLYIAREAIHQRFFDTNVDLLTNKGRDRLVVLFGESPSEAQLVELSSQCRALIDRRVLRGFVVDL